MDPSERKSLGEVIRALREASGLTRAELGTAAAISAEMVAKVEQGAKAPSARTLRALAESLGVEPLDLSGRAAAWEALAGAPGTTSAALRRIALGGVRTGPPLAAAAVGATLAGGIGGAIGAAAMATAMERRDRRQIENLLRELLEERINRAETKEDLRNIVEDLAPSE